MRNRAVACAVVSLSCLVATGCGGGDDPGVAERAAAAAVRGVDRARKDRTVNRLEQIRLALDRYAIDHDGTLPAGGSLEAAAAALVPTYTPRLDVTDAWGATLTYSSDGRSYTVASPGEDGRTGSDDDVVLRDGAITGGS